MAPESAEMSECLRDDVEKARVCHTDVMTLKMTDSCVVSIAHIKEFLKVNQAINFKSTSRKEKYEWIDNVLTKFNYTRLKGKKDKGQIKEYIQRMTGISARQLKRLVTKKKKLGVVTLSPNWG